ncbi:MAG: PopZ family protein, partial [Alphaproteobacteria bacterium]
SSVAREPSMEEILASIRRIIEESDTTRPDEALPLAVNSDEPAQAASAFGPADQDEAEAELAPREGIAVPQPAHASAFGHVALPLRPDAGEPAPAGPEASRPAPSDGEAATGQNVPAEDELPAMSAAAEREMSEDLAEVQMFEEPAAAEQPAAPISSGITQDRMDRETPVDPQRTLEPILSETTERQVSAAFDDLSFAVHSEQRRSFDEIAQDIMRPLLQDWLDNNLPTLVERLVREEIERVARGGKRQG